MAIISINTVHDADIGNGFRFDIQLRRVRRATAHEVQVDAPASVATKATPPQNAGTQQVQTTYKQANNKAADQRISDMVSGFGSNTGGIGSAWPSAM